MIRDITIGQFYPANSIIHKLDPRVKLFGTIAFIFMIFTIKNVGGYVLTAIALASVIKLSKIPVKYMLKGLKTILFILIFTAVLNIFYTPGTILFEYKFIRITEEGIATAVKMAVRLVFLIMGSSVMTLTTTPNHLTDGLERSLSPLKRIKIPVHEISMMMSIALRFIPILLEETDKIMKAQQARGADFETGNVFRRAKSLIPILIPLVISSFRRANDLAMAMEARCYHGGEGRTKMKPLKYYRYDYIAYLIIFLYIAGSIILNHFAPL